MREMRRRQQTLNEKQTEAVLNKGTWGVLALYGTEGYPYGVPINYAYDGEKILFHGSAAGHKFDAMQKNPAASFTVVTEDAIDEGEYTTLYRSAIAFGRVEQLEGRSREEALYVLAQRLSPSQGEEKNKSVAENCKRAQVFAFFPDRIYGKVGALVVP